MYSLPLPTGFVNCCRVLLTLIMRGAASTSAVSVGLVYVIGGGLKLCRLPGNWNQHLRDSFREFAKVTPLAPLGIVPDADLYQEVVGATEVALGGMLIFGSRPVQRWACVGLMGIMLGGAQTLISVGRPMNAFVPLTCLGLLLLVYTNLDDKSKDK